LLWDFETKTFTLIENSQNLQALQGAGIQSAQNVINTGAEALVTGHCGPKAFKVLQAAGIPIYVAESLPIRELIDSFEKGTLLQLKERRRRRCIGNGKLQLHQAKVVRVKQSCVALLHANAERARLLDCDVEEPIVTYSYLILL
jgi:predicted Fe-Mo cluster-binding NifX family protein